MISVLMTIQHVSYDECEEIKLKNVTSTLVNLTIRLRYSMTVMVGADRE